MFELLKNPRFDFMSKRKFFAVVSGVVVALALGLIFTKGFNRGVEFTGGTQLQIKYASTPDLAGIRSRLGEKSVVTRIGDEAENEVYIKIASDVVAEGDQASKTESTTEVLNKLRETRDGLEDLNLVDADVLSKKLAEDPAIDVDTARSAARSILAERKRRAIFASLSDLDVLPEVDGVVRSALEAKTYIGSFALRSQEYIFPSVGRELLEKAGWAIFGSLLGMLIYIWIRFQVQWGLAAVVALAHDTIITLGLLALFGKELTLPVVAAFLTLVGYSVNDTVVVFDRIRENIRARGARSMVETINQSINQTLSRTLITTGSTWLVVFGLFMFGGEALNPFAFVLTIGVLVGTYSSIFIASPLILLWQNLFRKGKERVREAGARRGRVQGAAG